MRAGWNASDLPPSCGRRVPHSGLSEPARPEEPGASLVSGQREPRSAGVSVASSGNPVLACGGQTGHSLRGGSSAGPDSRGVRQAGGVVGESVPHGVRGRLPLPSWFPGRGARGRPARGQSWQHVRREGARCDLLDGGSQPARLLRLESQSQGRSDFDLDGRMQRRPGLRDGDAQLGSGRRRADGDGTSRGRKDARPLGYPVRGGERVGRPLRERKAARRLGHPLGKRDH